MIRGILLILASLAAAASASASAQTTVEEARAAGKAFGAEKRADETLVPASEAQAAIVPGYAGTDLPEGRYFGDPERLEAEGQAAKAENQAFRITTDADRSRPTFGNAEILGVTNRATAVEQDPGSFLEGEALGGAAGACSPLPPAAGEPASYEASCNAGSKIEQATLSCAIRLVPAIETVRTYLYYAEVPFHTGMAPPISEFSGALADGTCTDIDTADTCAVVISYGAKPIKNCNRYRFDVLRCTKEVPGLSGAAHPATGQIWFAQETSSTVTTRRVDDCGELAGDGACVQQTEACTSSDPVTRTIDGVEVTQPCWAWSRTYQCNRVTPANDCAALESNAACSFARSECLDEESGGGPCKVENRVFRCTAPASAAVGAPQFICGGDVYCINGDCEPIVREASTEFRDALVALHAIDQAGKELDETDLRVFSGARETCHKPVFGLINCCAGKVSGLLTASAGAAALAGGPLAIAALATPFLTLFACSQSEMQLDIKDRMGLCHDLGSYCSSSVLGICKTKRKAYCCFESKLSRVLQEQGRPQLGKAWAAPKQEQCTGFSIDEFARLDLSVMDFTEVYADFMDAAKLPDEIETLSAIQQKIEDYYDLHGH